MNASKETARNALINLEGQGKFTNQDSFNVIRDFLVAAIRKLPSEESYAKERRRIEERKQTRKSKVKKA